MNYYRVPDILEQAKFVHGPRDLFTRYFEVADETARDLGVRLRLCWDFDRLIALNKQYRDCWPALPPIFDPELSTLTPDTAFWIEGVDEFGHTVATSAGRLYDHGDRSLADDLRSLRIFYDDPEPHLAAGEKVKVMAPSAEHIFGRVMYSGAVWVRPDYRRHGFTRIIPRLTRAYAMTQWNTPVFWMVIAQELDKGGVTRAYGSWHLDGRIAVHFPSLRDDAELLFGLMGQTTLIRDIVSSVYDTAVGTSRWTETPMISRSLPAERQGMSTRS